MMANEQNMNQLRNRVRDLEYEIRRLHRDNEKLAAERDRLSDKLRGRAVVEKAKGILQKRYGWPEDQAYRFLRERSQENSVRIEELARSITLVGTKLDHDL